MNRELTMAESFTHKGEWFLPSAKDKRIHGVLSYNIEDGITLDLVGVYDDNPLRAVPEWLSNHPPHEHSIILGETNEGKKITLYKNYSIPTGSIFNPASRYRVHVVLEGLHFENPEDMHFDTLESEIIHLDEWIGISGFDGKEISKEVSKILFSDEEHECQVNYKRPDTIHFLVSETLEGEFHFSLQSNGAHAYQKNVFLEQKVYLTLKYKQEQFFDVLLADLHKFKGFVTLALYERAMPKTIRLYNGNGEVKLFFQPIGTFPKRETPKTHFEMLFCYENIKDNFPELIKKWFEKYDILKPIFNLFIAQFYTAEAFMENKFLNLAQAAEAFHAHTRETIKMPKKDYDRMTKDILSSVNENYHDFLKGLFNFGNHLNLEDRLNDIMLSISCEFFDEIIEDRKKFMKQVKWLRNYYTHYSSDLKKHALKGPELFNLTQKLKVILVCAFLLEIGFDKDLLNKLLKGQKHRLVPEL